MTLGTDLNATREFLLLRALRVTDPAAVLRSLEQEDSWGAEVFECISKIQSLIDTPNEQSAKALAEIAPSMEKEWIEFSSFLLVKSRSAEVGPSWYQEVLSQMHQLMKFENYAEVLTYGLLAFARLYSGDSLAAQDAVLKSRSKFEEIASPTIRKICRPWVLFYESHLRKETGDFKSAHRLLRQVVEIARELKLSIELPAHTNLSSLYWNSGQPAIALEMHLDELVREKMRNGQRSKLLVRSHLCATKCALDCGAFEVAQRELAAAEILLRESTALPQWMGGYYKLYGGELSLHENVSDPRGFELLDAAYRHFEVMAPPFYAGILDSQISIANFAINRKESERLIRVLHSIFDKAVETGSLEARARCLVIESALFVSDDPPVREAFDNLVSRLHLINNPALLMQALANLFSYSLRYLDEPNQAFLMGRLRNLQKVMVDSCYQDIYERYIEKRYFWAIENRLAEILDGDQEFMVGEPSEER